MFPIVTEANTKGNKYRYVRQSWMKISRKIEPTIGDFNTRLFKCKLDGVIINSGEWITELVFIRGDLQNLRCRLKTHKLLLRYYQTYLKNNKSL